MNAGGLLFRVGAVVGLIATSVAGVYSPAGAASSWSLVGTAPGASFGHVAAVSCPSATTCIAVGTLDRAHSVSSLAERWNGAKWSALATPTPGEGGPLSSQLSAVSCTSATYCIAVGQFNTFSAVTSTLIMQWDGKKWTILPSPNGLGSPVSVLSGVSCATPTFCFAVGSSFVDTRDTQGQVTLVEQWNGTTWSVVPSPNQPLFSHSSLAAVTCVTTTNCLVVGSYDTQLATSTLAERWDGVSWSIVPSPNPKGGSESQLSGVACVTTANCFAVGTGHGTLIERWNGTAWGIVTSPNPTGATGASLTSVSCPSLTRCVAVGTIFRQNVVQRLVETYNGKTWSVTTVPVPSGTKLSNLSGVSCATNARCMAGGDFRLGGSRRPLFERYG